MEEDNVIALRQPGDFADPLTEVLRKGARALLAKAVEAEVAEALATHVHLTTDDGRRRLVRHGHMPERTSRPVSGRWRCASRASRSWRRRWRAHPVFLNIAAALRTPDQEARRSPAGALPARDLDRRHAGGAGRLAGQGRRNLSPTVLARLKSGWQEKFERWKRRDLSARRYVYIWADGVYLQARMEPDKQCSWC
jgi:putative transposase